MTIASIVAFLAFLSAFNIDPTTVKTVGDILYASQATSSIAIATSTPTTVTLTPNLSSPTPSFGATIITNQPKVMPQDQSDILITVTGPASDGSYAFSVKVLDTEGKPIKMAPVKMVAPDETQDRATDTQTGPHDADWHINLLYYPQTKGTQSIAISSGTLSKTFTVDVK